MSGVSEPSRGVKVCRFDADDLAGPEVPETFLQ